MKNINLNDKCIVNENFVYANPNLAYIDKNNNLNIFEDDCQFLYMYPLTILDYVKAYNDGHICKLVVKNFTIQKINVAKENLKLFSEKTNYRKCVEFEIKEDFEPNQDFENFLEYIIKKNILIVLNIKNNINLKLTKRTIGFINYIKFSIESCKLFERSYSKFFSKNLSLLKNTTINFKIYLNLEEVDDYRDFIDKYKNICNFVLFTKLLIDENKENIKLSSEVAEKLHYIKNKYETKDLYIKVVKNLNTLYYDLFQKDERNSRKCYVSKICNYLVNDKIFPCSTRQIINAEMSNDNPELEDYIENSCSDCASLFENDFLDKIFKTQSDNLFFVAQNELKNICPIGIGTFKLTEFDNIKYGINLGQNLIDCNLAYKQGETVKKISKIIKNTNLSKLFLYCKLYRKINSIEDINDQINEYINIFNTECLDILSIHSLEILGDLSLVEVYRYLEELKNKGIIKHIGICNVSLEQLKDLLNAGICLETFEGVYSYYCKYYEDIGLLKLCADNNIMFIAYQSLLMGKFEADTLLNSLAKKYDKSISQILLNYYILYKNIVPIIKSSNREHIYQNFNYDFYISNEDYEKLDNINTGKNFNVCFDKQSKNKIYQLSYNLIKKGENL